MDFGKLDTRKSCSQGAVMQVMHPATGLPIEGCTITLMGKDSDEYRKRILQVRRRSAHNQGKLDIDKTDNDAMQARVACTLSWTGFEENGKIFDPLPENFLYFYEKYDWLVEQVDSFIMERANFLK